MKAWNESEYTQQQVISNTQLAPGAFLLKFRKKYDFSAGQIVALGVSTDLDPRFYSIASAEDSDLVSVIYTEKPDGKLTPMLSTLKPGNQILVSKPFGTFTNFKPLPVLVAAGTGIAPYLSALQSNKATGATLIHGAPYPEYFYFSEYLSEKLGRNYIQCCSRCMPGSHFVGRVTSYLQHWDELNPSRNYYLCGSTDMVVETRSILISRGVPPDRINAEIYF